MTSGRSLLLQIGAAALLGVAAIVVVPAVLPLYGLINATIYMSMAVFTLSLALLWGHGGVLCFGQSAFFGLGAYAYAIAAINFGDTTFAVPLAILVPAGFAALLGYFLFYGRLGDVYLGVITLTVTLILFKLVNSTGGDAWRIGSARIGGFDGIPATPPLNWPFAPADVLTPEDVFIVSVCALVLAYAICKIVVATRFGRAAAAVRENEARAEFLGYDSRLLKLIVFCISGGIAGLAGLLFANAVFVSPTIFGLGNAAQVLIWVVIGGVGSFVGPIVASVLLQMLTTQLGTTGWIDPNIVLGTVLVTFVMFIPRGIHPALAGLAERMRLSMRRIDRADSAHQAGDEGSQ